MCTSERADWPAIAVVGVDPSSTCTGVARLVRETGSPPRVSMLARCLGGRGDYVDRVVRMAAEVIELIMRHGADVIGIEAPSQHTQARHRGTGAGLAVYGYAVGYMASAITAHCRGRAEVVLVPAERWAPARCSKTRRAAMLEREHPELRSVADPGLDVHDAVGIARHLLSTRKTEGARR